MELTTPNGVREFREQLLPAGATGTIADQRHPFTSNNTMWAGTPNL